MEFVSRIFLRGLFQFTNHFVRSRLPNFHCPRETRFLRRIVFNSNKSITFMSRRAEIRN